MGSAPLRFERVLANGILAVLLALLIMLPAQLFNATLTENYDHILARFGRVRRAVGRLLEVLQEWVPAPSVVGAGLFTVLAAAAGSALDPDFPAGLGSLRLMLAQILGLSITTYAVCGLALAIGRRYGTSGRIRVRPAGLLVCFAVVPISRALDVSPGFLYGIVVGVQFRAPLAVRQIGRVALIQAGFLLTVAVSSWLALDVLRNAMSMPEPGFVPSLGAEVLTALSIGAPTSLVLSFVPVTYLRGERVFVWSRQAWLAAYALILFVFLSIAANPVFGSLPSTTSLSIWLSMYGVFGVGSVLFWARFRGTEGRSAVDRLTGAAARRI